MKEWMNEQVLKEVVLVVNKEQEGEQKEVGGRQDTTRAVLDRVHSRLLR